MAVCVKTMVLIRGPRQLLLCPETGDTDLLRFRRAEKSLGGGHYGARENTDNPQTSRCVWGQFLGLGQL